MMSNPLPDAIELSVVMPCLNEVETLETCIRKASIAMHSLGIRGEIIVGDNGSTDGSVEIAQRAGARVVHVAEQGYGNAVHGVVQAAQGRFVIMGDADDSYDFSHLKPFWDRLQEGDDLVMGNRFRGGIAKGAMPFLHRHLGNPVLSGLGRLLFHCPCGDFHCGLRGFRKDAFERMQLRTTGMEFASEMVVKATLLGMTISEVPTTLSPDGRSRSPHLRTWRDGWRHLRFLLLYSPDWLFLYPGLALIALGLGVMLWLLPQSRLIGAVTLDIHTLIYAGAGVFVGYQAVWFALFAKVYAITTGMLPDHRQFMRWCDVLTLEKGLTGGAAMVVLGLAGTLWALVLWQRTAFGDLDVSYVGRIVFSSVMCLTLGIQTILASFFLSLLSLQRK